MVHFYNFILSICTNRNMDGPASHILFFPLHSGHSPYICNSSIKIGVGAMWHVLANVCKQELCVSLQVDTVKSGKDFSTGSLLHQLLVYMFIDKITWSFTHRDVIELPVSVKLFYYYFKTIINWEDQLSK